MQNMMLYGAYYPQRSYYLCLLFQDNSLSFECLLFASIFCQLRPTLAIVGLCCMIVNTTKTYGNLA